MARMDRLGGNRITARRFQKYLLWGFVSFFIATLVFLFFPNMDMVVSRWLLVDGEFIIRRTLTGDILRNIFRGLYTIAIITAFAGMVIHLVYGNREDDAKTTRWIFVFLVMSVGPGLVSNVMFKGHWGRARPYHVAEFGGKFGYTPPLVRSDQCRGSNCSFFSGEASNMFALFFALALIASGLMRRSLMIAAIFAGLGAGLVRMGQGAHFLSDVIFAGVFMWLTALAMWWLVFVYFYGRRIKKESAQRALAAKEAKAVLEV